MILYGLRLRADAPCVACGVITTASNNDGGYRCLSDVSLCCYQLMPPPFVVPSPPPPFIIL